MPEQEPKKRGRPHRLTDKQRVWIAEYITDMNCTRAARVAGFKHPDVASAKLLNPDKFPLVARAVREAIARKELVAERKADDVLRYIHAAMFFCPGDYFDPGGKGGWLISQESHRNLPPQIKCLIEEMETRTVETEEGTTHTLWVRFVSKATAMTLAAKHQLGEKIAVTTNSLSWEIIAAGVPDGPVPDLVEQEIMRVLEQPQAIEYGLKELPANERPMNRLERRPSRNGDGHA